MSGDGTMPRKRGRAPSPSLFRGGTDCAPYPPFSGEGQGGVPGFGSDEGGMGSRIGTILIATLALSPLGAAGDTILAGVSGILDSTSSISKTSETSKDGAAASEILRGNGTRAGYILGHGNVIPGSEWIYVGVKHARVNVDYTIDYSSGSIYFAEPVRQSDAIRIDYKYSASGRAERLPVNMPGILPFRIGNSLATNLTYSYRAADSSKAGAPDILTYGLNMSSTLGGVGSLSSLVYMSNPQASNRLTITNGTVVQPAAGPQIKKDRLIAQDAQVGVGSDVKIRMGFQDVGEDFAGFSSLRDSQAAAADKLAILEREKGLKRMDVGMQIATSEKSGFDFSANRVTDKLDSINTQSFGYSSSSFRLSYMMRDVGKSFSRFKDIREEDRGQLAAEAGVKRTNMGLQFATGFTSGNPIWSGLTISRLENETGQLTYESANIDLGRFKVQADIREADPTFNKLTALSDEERGKMALSVKRQFDPAAQLAQIDPKDKALINGETGLNRRNVGLEFDSGPGKIWLGLADASSDKGKLTRRSLVFQGKSYSAYFGTQSIDAGFDKIARMQSVERARYGNEVGMNRTEMGGKFTLGFGELNLSHASVSDHQGAGIDRGSVDFKGTRLKFRANFQNIDARFSRVADLTDADRNLLARELGFRRSDYAINFQATKALNIDSYAYSSTNSTAGQTRSQNRHSITYAPERGLRFTTLSDDFSGISEVGTPEKYSHRKITFDNKFTLFGGLMMKGLHDVNTVQQVDGSVTTTEIMQTHLESDQNLPTSYTIDTLRTDFGDSHRFIETWDTGFKTRIANGLKLTGGMAKTAREDDKSEANGRVGIDWMLRKDLTMSLKIANRDGGPDGSRQARQWSMKGTLLKRLLMLRDVTIDSGSDTTQLQGKQIACDNGLRMNATIFGGKAMMDNSDKLNTKTGRYYTSRVVQYESAADPKLPYHLTFFRQNLVTQAGLPARKHNYALDLKLSPAMGFTLSSYYGKDGKDGAVLPLGGTVFKLTRVMSPKLTIIADYTANLNESTSRSGHTMGLGFTGSLPNGDTFDVYGGRCRLIELGAGSNDYVYRFKFNHKIDASRFIGVTILKRSAIERSTTNPNEGDVSAQLDLSTLFH